MPISRFSVFLFGRAAIAFACVAAAGCSARFDVALAADGSAGTVLSAALEPKTAALLAAFAAGPGPLLAAGAVADALRAAPGVRPGSVSLENPDAKSLRGSFALADVDAFLKAAPAAGTAAAAAAGLVALERRAVGGKLAIVLERSAAPALLATLSPAIRDYLEALMAPAVTGEDLDAAAYLAAVKSVYGKDVAAEVGAAKLKLAVQLPGTATAARGGTVHGKTVEFVLPLVELLVLEKPIRLEAEWE